MARPRKTVPSASARIAGTWAADTAYFLEARYAKRGGQWWLPRSRKRQIIPQPRARRYRETLRPACCLRGSVHLIRHAEASVDEQDVAGHIVRGARRQKDRGAGDFGRIAPASGGRAPGNPG